MVEGKNSKSESQEEPPKNERQFNQEQYDMLMRCSEKEDMTEWNEWRKKNPKEKIFLEGANIAKARQVSGTQEVFHMAYLKGAILNKAHLGGADLRGSRLQGAFLNYAHLEKAKLENAHLEGATLHAAHLEGANLLAANLNGVDFMFANLNGAILNSADLKGAQLFNAQLKGTYLIEVSIEEASFEKAIVDSSTFLWECKVDRRSAHKKGTNFIGVGLDRLRIDSATKQLLEYNVRRRNWGEWYKEHRALQWPVKVFWSISDYGIRTLRIIIWFFGLALFFAGLYYVLSVVSPPGVVSSLVEGKEGPVPGWLIPFRSIYFSIVTMTTLGFGDMHANCRSFLGHLLLTIQVILGYVLLGALVTRLAVLFTSDGPAGSYTPMDTETKELLAKLKEDKKKAR